VGGRVEEVELVWAGCGLTLRDGLEDGVRRRGSGGCGCWREFDRIVLSPGLLGSC
jgi:hypothetical protein